ncbi:MAG: hypothetical protein ACUVWP_09400, partial [bacterium]
MITLKKGLTGRELRERVNEIRKEMARLCSPLPEDERIERIKRVEEDPILFGQIYLPHYFTDPSPPFHHEIINLLEKTRGIPVVIAAPRDHAKSTVVCLCYALHAILFNRCQFILYICANEEIAMEKTFFVRLELDENERIAQDFGELRRHAEWADDMFTTTTGIHVRAKGLWQRIRGIKYRQHRPDLIILDDIEDDEMQFSPRRLDKQLRAVLERVYPACQKDGRLII